MNQGSTFVFNLRDDASLYRLQWANKAKPDKWENEILVDCGDITNKTECDYRLMDVDSSKKVLD